MPKIEINIDEKTLQSINIKSNTIFMLKPERPLSAVECDLLYTTVLNIIYNQTGIKPSMIIMPYGIDLEIVPDHTLITLMGEIKEIMNRRAEVC